MSDFVKHGPCPKCGSSNANGIYTDGHTYCHKCHHYVNGDGEEREVTEEHKEKKAIRPLANKFYGFDKRGLKKETIQRFGVTIGDAEHERLEAVYPYFDNKNVHIANKIRFEGKEFVIEGEWKKATLFGQQAFPAGSAKQITLTEGQDDAMAAYEMQGSRFPCVSVASASSAVKDVQNNWEYLDSFEMIVIAFDADKPGKDAAEAVAGMFKPNKVRILQFREGKDANDYLLAGKVKEFIKEWWDAAPFTPSGLRLGPSMWDEVKTPKNYETAMYPWEGLNYSTYGLRLSEFVLVTAQTKVGKTTMLKEIESHLLKTTKRGIGFIHLEESNSDTCLGLMSIEANKPLHLPDVRQEVSEDELRRYFDTSCNDDRVVIWDHFGSNTIEEVLSKIRHMHNLGCKYIVLDHLSIIVSDQSGDERKQLDEISTKLKMLCMELNICVIAVIHQNRQNQIRSSAGPEQIANITIKLSRDTEDADEWRRNVTKVSIQYNRFCGRTGPCCWLFYEPQTGRLRELDKAEIVRYEKGQTAVQAEESWK